MSDSDDESESTEPHAYAPSKGIRRSVIEDSVSELPEYREPRTAQLRALKAIYSALIRHGDAFGAMRLSDHYLPADVDAPEQGSYREFQPWYDARGKDDLLSLPGVSETDSGLRFAGLTADEVEDLGLTVSGSPTTAEPASEIREHPRTQALVAIDRRYLPGSDDHSALLELWDEIANSGETTSDELSGTRILPPIEAYEDSLSALPGIDTETIITSPEDIPIHTYADVLAARELFDDGRKTHHTETIWRHTGGSWDRDS